MKFLLFIFLIASFKATAAVDKIEFFQMSSQDKVNYLWAKAFDEGLDPVYYYSFLENIDYASLSVADKLRLKKLESDFGNKSLKFETIESLSYEDALAIASEKEELLSLPIKFSLEAEKLISLAQEELNEVSNFEALTQNEILDLFDGENAFSTFQNGKYSNGVKLFLFCRHDRSYPCLFVMKDRHNQIVRNDDGTIWSLPGLAYSRRKLPFNITNGQTPLGVHSMNSVMPEANNQSAYGKWRRVILNFLPKVSGEESVKEVLPSSSQSKNWWKQASIARDVGRQFLRIHGTGNRNDDRSSSHYTFFGTSGCVSTQENTYDGVEYKGQRLLLDKLMQTMDLLPKYSNETKINGLFYVIELDQKKSKVTLDDLSQLGIK